LTFSKGRGVLRNKKRGGRLTSHQITNSIVKEKILEKIAVKKNVLPKKNKRY